MEQPSYYSITPAVVRYDSDLKSNEKLLYGEITALSNKFGYCTASNGYFAPLYDVKKETVSRWISHLNEKGYIKVQVIRNDNKTVKQRRIYVSDIREVLTKKSIGYCQKDQDPIDQKVKENITSNNTTSINITSSSSISPHEEEDKKAMIKDLIRIVKKYPTTNDEWHGDPYPDQLSAIKKMAKRMKAVELSMVVCNFATAMGKYGIYDPYSYLLKMLREETRK